MHTQITVALMAPPSLLACVAGLAAAVRTWPADEFAGYHLAATADSDGSALPGGGSRNPPASGRHASVAPERSGGLIAGILARLTARKAARASATRSRRVSRQRGPEAAELGVRADRVLVETDDAVRTSEQELAFAVARFGERPAAGLTAAVKSARAELAAAFQVRQRLDSGGPRTDRARRAGQAEVVGRCAEANRLLDEQAVAFDQLHDRQTCAAEILAEVDHYIGQQEARASRYEQILGELASKYTALALTAVADSTGQARDRLAFARATVTTARSLLETRRGGDAAVFLQAAESAADQAESLLDGIRHREAELTQASSALPTALREIGSDIAAAQTLLADKPGDRAGALARAQVAVSAIRGQLAAGRPFDALTALRLLTGAASALDHALAGARSERDRRDRASAILDEAMLVARSSITAAEDFVATRRGGVGALARTRLAAAHMHFQQVIALAPHDPAGALAQARHADALGQQARSLAELDVSRSPAGTAPVDPAILGGILIVGSSSPPLRDFDGNETVARRNRRDRASSSGGATGHQVLSGFGTPGSFGGIGTRARRSFSGAG